MGIDRIPAKLKDDSKKPKKPLRLGLLCQSDQQPLWIRKALWDLISSNVIDIQIVVVQNLHDQSLLDRFRSFLTRSWEHRDCWAYLIYYAIDRKIHRYKHDAHDPGGMGDMLSTTPWMLIDSEIIHSRVRLGETDLTTILSYNLDVLLCQSLILEGCEELKLATFGIWTFDPPLNAEGAGVADVFWRSVEGFPVTQFRLSLQQAPSKEKQTLCRSVLPTCLPEDSRSIYRASNRMLWTAGAWLSRTLQNLYLYGIESLPLMEIDQTIEPIMFTAPVPPANNRMIRIMTKRCAQRTNDWIKGMMAFDRWNIGYKLDDTIGDALGIPQFNRMTPPKDRFWADPFPVRGNDRYFIFIEEFIYSRKKGHISVIEMDTDGHWRKPEKILERDYHLSYPGVFCWGENYYMLPESGQNRTIELYKCIDFPFRWELDRILINGIDAADPTIAEINGVWWLFAATRPYDVIRDDNYMELHVFHADSPIGPWEMIHNNPVKSDVRSTRPAGNIFWWNGGLYRPAQDCSTIYGYAVSINRITELTNENFREKEVAKIYPESIPGSTCVHTINRCEGLTVIDMMRNISRL